MEIPHKILFGKIDNLWELDSSVVQEKYNESQIGNLKCSSSHISKT